MHADVVGGREGEQFKFVKIGRRKSNVRVRVRDSDDVRALCQATSGRTCSETDDFQAESQARVEQCQTLPRLLPRRSRIATRYLAQPDLEGDARCSAWIGRHLQCRTYLCCGLRRRGPASLMAGLRFAGRMRPAVACYAGRG